MILANFISLSELPLPDLLERVDNVSSSLSHKIGAAINFVNGVLCRKVCNL